MASTTNSGTVLDSEPIMLTPRDDIGGIVFDMFGRIQFKLLLAILIAFLYLQSGHYYENVLDIFDGAVEYKYPTTWGYMISMLLFALVFIVIDGLIRNGVL